MDLFGLERFIGRLLDPPASGKAGGAIPWFLVLSMLFALVWESRRGPHF